VDRASEERASADSPAGRLASALQRVIDLRAQLVADHDRVEAWRAVKRWQSERLRRTYRDLLESKRYAAACEFFLSELYGERDFEQRDREALRIVPKLARVLPHKAVETIALAVELDELSETLDARVAAYAPLPLDEAGYIGAYRAAGTRAERQHQVDMIASVGASLDKLARLPLLAGVLHIMRGPAEAAGLLHLHRFLSQGFDIFKAMGGAREFLKTIEDRERALIDQWLGPAAG
jgi:hypothetical protein